MVRVIDANGLILGRLCSVVAKDLLRDEELEVAIVNSEGAIVTGQRDHLLARYRFKREVGTHRKGPFFPRMPDRLVKRTVRGMLPMTKAKGRLAHARVKCYIGVPPEFEGATLEVPERAKPRSQTPHVTVGELSKSMGAKVR